MTTMEKLVEAYLEKERVIKEQAEVIMKLQAELEKEKETAEWAKRVARTTLYGHTITKEDREKGKRFRSRLVEKEEN